MNHMRPSISGLTTPIAGEPPPEMMERPRLYPP